MDAAFLHAFDHAMLYEVGGFWNSNDPDVITGRMDTRERQQKVGYVNIPADRGGETKYGIAKNANPSVYIRGLNLDQAMDIYFQKYWLRGYCNLIPYPLSTIHFDGCANHGPSRACKFLQRAAGVTEDGIIGRQTVAAIHSKGQAGVIRNLAEIRTDFYQSIVSRNPSQRIFLKGWLRRIDEVEDYSLSQLE